MVNRDWIKHEDEDAIRLMRQLKPEDPIWKALAVEAGLEQPDEEA